MVPKGQEVKEDSYTPVTADIAAEIGEMCGPDNVLYDQPDKLERYAHDQVSEKKFTHPPELVARPETVDEVAEILKLAHRMNVPVTPRPQHRMALLALFKDAPAATRVIPQILIQGRIVPSAVEFMDRLCFKEACKSLGESLPYEQAGTSLLFEVDGSHEDSVRRECGFIERICRESGAVQTLSVKEPEQIERFWKIANEFPGC